MKDSRKLMRRIICDCEKVMRVVVLFYILQSVLNEYISIYTASVLGSLANAVLKMDISFAMQQFWKVIGCVFLSVVLLPVLETFAEMMMFRKSLRHDQMLLQRFLNKTYTAYYKLNAGDIQFHMDDDACDFRIKWVQLVTKGITVPVALIYLFYQTLSISLLYTMIVLLISIIQLAVPVAAQKLRKKYDMQTREHNAEIRVYEADMTLKPHMIRILGLKKPWVQRFDKLFDDYYQNIFAKNIRYLVFADTILKLLNTFCVFIILIAGAILASQKRITAGMIVAMMGYFSIFHSIIADIGFMIQNIPILFNLANRLKDIYEGGEKQGGMRVKKVQNISVENLSFQYGSNYSNESSISKNTAACIFQGINFKVNNASKMALCGKNGGGKSTLLKVLCGLLEGYNGKIFIDGQVLSNIDVESWRNQISYIEQESFLFAGSVFENIQIGNLEASRDLIEQIMEEVGITYLANHIIDANKAGLSGGERQKISIARALLKDTPILIMDEPNNNLDEETILWLREFIITVPKTVIFVSHDKEFMESVDYKTEL